MSSSGVSQGTEGGGESKDTVTSYFINYCYSLVFTLVDIISPNFLELHSTLRDTIFLSQIFLSQRYNKPL